MSVLYHAIIGSLSQENEIPSLDQEEKRIFVVVNRSVEIEDEVEPSGIRRVFMNDGRMAAQACHVTGKYRAQSGNGSDITTIILEARNSREMFKICDDFISKNPTFKRYAFLDTDPDFYGTDEAVLTAICTEPTTRSEVEPFFGYLDPMKAPR